MNPPNVLWREAYRIHLQDEEMRSPHYRNLMRQEGHIVRKDGTSATKREDCGCAWADEQ